MRRVSPGRPFGIARWGVIALLGIASVVGAHTVIRGVRASAATDQSSASANAPAPLAALSAAPTLVQLAGPRTLLMEVTAYCPCTRCCGPKAQGITASGRPVAYNAGRFVAADTQLLPFGTRLSIPGYHDGQVVEVIDRGGAIKGNKLDVYFPDHQTAREWGRQWVVVTIYP